MFTSFWKLHGEKIISVLKGGAIASLGVFFDIVIRSVLDIEIPEEYIGLHVAALSVLVNIIRKFGIPVTVSIFKK